MEKTTYEISFVGAYAVGKTTIIYRAIKGNYKEDIQQTIGMNSSFSQIQNKDGETIDVKFVDTAGQEKFQSLIINYIRNSNIVLYVFDFSNPSSFEKLCAYKDRITEQFPYIKNIIIGNKIDIIFNQFRTKFAELDTQATELAKRSNCPYLKISAKTGENFPQLMETICSTLKELSIPKQKEEILLTNDLPNSQQNQSCC